MLSDDIDRAQDIARRWGKRNFGGGTKEAAELLRKFVDERDRIRSLEQLVMDVLRETNSDLGKRFHPTEAWIDRAEKALGV